MRLNILADFLFLVMLSISKIKYTILVLSLRSVRVDRRT